jgi:hypothetical protein
MPIKKASACNRQRAATFIMIPSPSDYLYVMQRQQLFGMVPVLLTAPCVTQIMSDCSLQLMSLQS